MSYIAGDSVSIPELKWIFVDNVLNSWTLEAQTIEFLWQRLLQDEPQVILEFGSGISTLMFATYASLSHSRVISIEQEERFVDSMMEKLGAVGLCEFVGVLHIPTSSDGAYDFGELDLRTHLDGRCVDWVLIDGPSGPHGCRWNTLPFALDFCCDGAVWFMHDALRMGELRILDEWCSIDGVVVDGIYPIGHGLAIGSVSSLYKD